MNRQRLFAQTWVKWTYLRSNFRGTVANETEFLDVELAHFLLLKATFCFVVHMPITYDPWTGLCTADIAEADMDWLCPKVSDTGVKAGSERNG